MFFSLMFSLKLFLGKGKKKKTKNVSKNKIDNTHKEIKIEK